MALFHFHVDQISRGKGQSAIAAAAYRAGSKMFSEYYNEFSDYTKRQDVICSDIFIPEYVPERLKDRATLWNEIEKIEKNPRSQLAYSFNIALQDELSMAENIRIATEFCNEQFVSRGMIVDFAVHQGDSASDEPENPHFHVMIPIRPMKENGTWGEKQRREYILDENGDKVLDKKGKPKFMAVSTTGWGSPELLREWRESWAMKVNQTFEKNGICEKIDHRSYADRGMDLIPTIHEGPAVRAMEARGIKTEIGELNREIKFFNIMKVQLMEIVDWCSAVYNKAVDALNKRQNPTLFDLINETYEKRNKKAQEYVYGSKKAERTNFKEYTGLVDYLMSKNIYNMEQLDHRLKELQVKALSYQKDINNRKTDIDKLQTVLDCLADRREHKDVMHKYQGIFFKGRKHDFYEEHKKELNAYRRAERVIHEYEQENGKVNPSEIRKKIAALSKNKILTEEQKKPFDEELKYLNVAKKYVNQALADRTNEEGGQQKKETKSIHNKLQKIQAEQKKEQAEKQKNRSKDMEL